MLLKPIAVATAGLAATCQAFLLPPEVSEADIAIADKVSSLAELAPEFARTTTLLVDCPGCPVQVKNRHGHMKVKNGKANHLELNFAIDHQADGADRLLLNGFELYPNSDPFHSVLSAPQILDKKLEVDEDGHAIETTQLKSHHKMRPQHLKEIIPQQLGFSLQIHPAAKDKDGQEYKVIELDLQIIEVGNRFVDSIPNVNIKLIKDGSANLAIANLQSTAPQLQTLPTDKQEECVTMMCKWLAIVKDKMYKTAHMKTPCHSRPGSSNNKVGMGQNQLPGHIKHHSGHPHFHHMHGQHRSWTQLLKNITTHILLPILIGVVAGVTASLIGMVVGTAIVFVWRTFFRRSHRGDRRGHAHKAAPRDAAVAEEKSGLMEHQDPPPSYEEEVVKETGV